MALTMSNKLLGSTRTDTCHGCLEGKNGKVMSKSQVVIAVKSSTFTMKCSTCGTLNKRKLSSLDIVPKYIQGNTFASLRPKK